MRAGVGVAALARRAGPGLRCWVRRIVAAQAEVDAVAIDMLADQRRRTVYALPLLDDELFDLLQRAADRAVRVRRAAWRGRDVDSFLAEAATARLVRADIAREAMRRCRRCRRPGALHCPGCSSCWPDHSYAPGCDADEHHRAVIAAAVDRHGDGQQ